MKFNSLNVFAFSISILVLSSCLGTTETALPSSDATFVSLTFKANDSIPNLNTAVFTLIDTTITNVDSLPYATRIDSVYPTFTFKSSSGAILFFKPGTKNKKDTIGISGKDTVDFTLPVTVKNLASDAVAYKFYAIKVNVHKVSPETYIWSKVNYDVPMLSNQKAIVLNDKVLYFSSDGASVQLNISNNGWSLNSAIAVNGLPADISLRNMTLFAGKLYLTKNDEKIYSSSNGTDWTVKSISDYNFKSLLFELNGKLLAVLQSKVNNTKYYFANSTDAITWVTSVEIPSKFPISDFAALSFTSRSGKAKGIVIGGKDISGNALRTNWNTENGSYWVNFRADYQPESISLDTLEQGASIIEYDNKLLFFGMRSDTIVNHFRVSLDEGFTWKAPDTLYNRLPITYKPRNYQSVVVLKQKKYSTSDSKQIIEESNRIFIFGGKNGSTIYSDVWTGKLNRKNFLIQ